MKDKKNKILNVILPILSIGCLLLVWAIASYVVDSEFILPSISQTASEFIKLFGDGAFYYALVQTFIRSLVSFVISFSLAFLFAFLTTKSRVLDRILSPLVSVTRALPTIAIALILYYWLSNSVAAVVVTMLVVFPTAYTNVKNAFGEVDRKLIDMCDVFNVPKKDKYLKVVVPQLMPALLSSIGSGISLNVKLMVAAEVLCETAYSIGILLRTAKVYYDIATMLALVVVCVIISSFFEFLFNALSKKAGRWK